MRVHVPLAASLVAALTLLLAPSGAWADSPVAQAGSSPVRDEPSGGAAEPLVPDDAATVEQTQVLVPPAADVRPDEQQRDEQQPAAPPPDPGPGDLLDPAHEPVVAEGTDGPDRLTTDPVDTSDAQTVGVTWPQGAAAQDLQPAVRTLDDGRWSPWQDLTVSDIAPDEGSADERHARRDGTDPLWIGDAEAIQLSFAATAEGGPDDLRLTLVGSPQVETQQAASRSFVRGATDEAASVTAAPKVVTRAQWGARPQVCAPDVASGLVGAAVHHTAGSNAYSTVAEAMQQIRNDQAYHIEGRGWCDLGYNFVVDKWGNIYEGRARSMSQPVVGVHAGGFNTGTVGVAMLGDYSTLAPPAATVEAVARVIGWRLGAYGIKPTGSMDYTTGSGENSRFHDQTVHLPRVFGHRDVAYTACPGKAGYAALPRIRKLAASYSSARLLGESQAVVRKLYRDVLGREVDPAGLQGWSVAMANGMSAAEVATSLATSVEYAFATVARDYQDVLGRDPDPAGLTTWTDAIIRGTLRSEDLRIWLYGSLEYYIAAGRTDAAYVAALYTDVLGRKGSRGEVESWVPTVRGGGADAVVRGFWASWENANLRVEGFYQRYLGRSADPAGLATWPQVLIARGEGELRSQLVGSVEYRNQAVAAAAAAA